MNSMESTQQDELAASVERVLLDQARRSELFISYVRSLALVLAAGLDYLFYLDPRTTLGLDRFSLLNAALAAVWCAPALVVMAGLRRGWYRPSLRWALPLLDGLAVFSLIAATFMTAVPAGSPDLHPVVVTASVCTFLAITGALRLSRLSALLTTLMGVILFAYVSYLVSYTLAQTAFVCVMIASAGVLGLHIADVARRAVESETRRIILQRFLPAKLVTADAAEALGMISRPRQVDATILVSDMRGFTAFAENAAPEAVLAFLNRLQGAFAAAVREQGGAVDKFIGDGMLAVFGVMEPLPDHAVHALEAARAMLAAVSRLNAERARTGESAIGVGIGVHSGEVIAGCLGSGLRLELTVIGDAVNTASRLESSTKDLGVALLVSEASAKLIAAQGGAYAAMLKPAGEISLRGRQQRLRVFTAAWDAPAGA